MVEFLEPAEVVPGAAVELAFTVNGLTFRVRAQVKAVRSETSVGVFFVQLSERVNALLEDLIEELTANSIRYEANKAITAEYVEKVLKRDHNPT